MIIINVNLKRQIERLTHSWIYCRRNGEALKLSTGQSKKPWISFWCRSIVMTWFSPALHIIFATSLETMHPLLRILPKLQVVGQQQKRQERKGVSHSTLVSLFHKLWGKVHMQQGNDYSREDEGEAECVNWTKKLVGIGEVGFGGKWLLHTLFKQGLHFPIRRTTKKGFGNGLHCLL